jgi:WD40 repeat protein
MSRPAQSCPQCGSDDIRPRPKLSDWTCDNCGHAWKPEAASVPQSNVALAKVRLFLSYGRRDAKDLADRLSIDLTNRGYEVWQDTHEIDSGASWQHEVVDGLRSSQVVVALMTPNSVRMAGSCDHPDNTDSVCLGEIAYALFRMPPRPVVPVMARTCEPPLAIFHLDYVDMRSCAESSDQYQAGLERLVSGIEAALRGERRYRSWYHQLNPCDFAAFLYPKRRNFCGRQWLFDRIDAWRKASCGERALLIKGGPGTGKSAVVAELVHRNPGGQVLAYHCCQWDYGETLEPWRFIRSVAAMIASKMEEYSAMLGEPTIQESLGVERCQTKPDSALEEGVLAPLQCLKAPEGGPRYLLVDAMDEALLVPTGTWNLVDLLASRLDRFPPWLKVVATTRNEVSVLHRLGGLRAEEIDAQSSENLDDVRQYIAQRLSLPNLSENLVESGRHTEQIADELCDKSEGNFLYVEQSLNGVERGVHTLHDLAALPPGLDGLYTLRFGRQFPDRAGFAPAKQLFDVIVAAREPLTEQQLAAATGLDIDDHLPPVLEQLSSYVPARPDGDGQQRYAIYHKSLSDWLTDRSRRGHLHSANPKRGHRRLADANWREYQLGPPAMSRYGLAHLPAHLVAAERWQDIETLLTDPTFLEAKTAAGLVFDLAGDFTIAVDALPDDRPQRRILKLLNEALRRDLHFIARRAQDYPQGLFQCLWNTCWWYDCDEAAAHYENGRPPGLRAIYGRGPGGEGRAETVPKDQRLCHLLENWREQKEQADRGFMWLRSHRPPPIHLGSPQLAVLRGHAGNVKSVSYSPDGRRVVSGSLDRTIRVWDARSGAGLTILQGHEEGVLSVSYSPDGSRIVSGSADRTIRVWDAESGGELAVLRGHECGINQVCFSPDGRRIVSGSADKTVRVWDVHTAAELAVLRGHEDSVKSVSYSPDGSRIVSGSLDKTIRIWDTQRWIEVAVLRGHEDKVESVSYSPDSRQIVSGSLDHTVRVWDAQSGAELHVLRNHDFWVTSVSYSPDGQRIVSGSVDNTVRVWDAQKGAELFVLRGHEKWIESASFSFDGRRIVSSSNDKTLRVWDAHNGSEVTMLRGHTHDVSSISYRPDGLQVVSSGDSTVRTWDAQTGIELAILHGHEYGVRGVSYSQDGRQIASVAWDSTLRVWDAQSGTELVAVRGHHGWVWSVSYSPDSRQIVTGGGCNDKTVRVWDAHSGAEIQVLRGHRHEVRGVSFGPDGQRIVTGSVDRTVRVWDAQSGEELAVLRGHGGDVLSVSYSRDGQRIVSSGAYPDKTIRVWDAQSGECLAIIEGEGDVRAIAAGATRFPWRALARGQETVIENGFRSDVAAWYPVPLTGIVTHPFGRGWAGSVASYLCLITLEGGRH